MRLVAEHILEHEEVFRFKGQFFGNCKGGTAGIAFLVGALGDKGVHLHLSPGISEEEFQALEELAKETL